MGNADQFLRWATETYNYQAPGEDLTDVFPVYSVSVFTGPVHFIYCCSTAVIQGIYL